MLCLAGSVRAGLFYFGPVLASGGGLRAACPYVPDSASPRCPPDLRPPASLAGPHGTFIARFRVAGGREAPASSTKQHQAVQAFSLHAGACRVPLAAGLQDGSATARSRRASGFSAGQRIRQSARPAHADPWPLRALQGGGTAGASPSSGRRVAGGSGAAMVRARSSCAGTRRTSHHLRARGRSSPPGGRPGRRHA